MIPGELANYIQYFRDFATQHPEVQFFHFGQVERGIDFARGLPGFQYPFVWLEQPEILTDDNGMSQIGEIYLGGVVVLDHGQLDDPDLNVSKYISTMNILYDLQKQIKRDVRDCKIVCNLSEMKKETVSTLWADAHYGWRLEFKMYFNINYKVC